MRTLTSFIGRHALPIYFVLTFAISWGGVLLVIGGPRGIPGTKADTDPLFPLVFLAMLAGPSIAGVLLTAVVDGKRGLREFLFRLMIWHVGGRWYAAALLTAPFLATSILLALSRLSPAVFPGIVVTNDKARLVLFGLAVAFGAGFFEELGWTGFAIPELRRRYSVLTTGLILGALWGAWHWLVVVWGIGGRAGTLPLAVFVLLDSMSVLLVFRILMVWVYEQTGSLLVGILMHVSLTATALIFTPLSAGAPLLMYDLVLAAALWLVVAVVAIIHGGRLSHPSARRQLA